MRRKREGEPVDAVGSGCLIRRMRVASFACRLLLPALLAAGAAPAMPAQETKPDPMLAAIRARLVDRPDDPTLWFYLARRQAGHGMKADALASLGRLLECGDGFLPDDGFAALGQDPAYRALRERFAARLPRVVGAPVAFTLDEPRFIPEGIAYDPVGKDFYVGSVAQRRIVRVTLPARWVRPWSEEADKLGHVLGLAVDAPRRRLWAVCTNALTDAGRMNPGNRLVGYDLAKRAKIFDLPVPGAAQLNDVAVAPDGALLATDSEAGGVWRVDPATGAGAALVPAGALPGANGIAFSADGRTLYVAHGTGVARVDPASGKFERLAPPPRETIAAIDGLYWHEGDLLGIQNVTNPARVIRVRLADGGTKVAAVETLQSHHHPNFDEPTTGAVADGAFHVLATTQVARFNAKGELDSPRTLKKPVVLAIPLAKP